MHTADLPETVPVFPLPGALLLPRGHLPLHIFEPRYLAMIEDCLKTKHRLIGIIQPREVSNKNGKCLNAIGCAGRLTGFSETEDSRYMITLSGISRFCVKEELQSFAPYRRCTVDWSNFIRDLSPQEEDPTFQREEFLTLLNRFFLSLNLSTDWSSLKEAETELLINSLSMLCPFTPEDKQALLEAPSLSKRRETLVTLIEFAMRGGTGKNKVMQ